MKNYIFGIILLLLSVFPLAVCAQQAKCSISGRVVDENKIPVAYASVALYNAATPITGVVTDDTGQFFLSVSRSDKEMRLAVEFIGYSKFEKTVRLNLPRINLGDITIKEDALSLGEVVISADEIAHKSTVEHTTINASANMASDKGTALDILRTSSSVNVSDNGISIRGNSNILVLLDGVPTAADDLSTIAAASIKSIEVVTNPDASHDAGGTGGIINIISKKSRAEGFSGMAALNYGFNHFTTGNVAFTSNRKKMSWRFSYNTKYEDDVVKSTLARAVKSTGYEVYQRMRSTRYTFNNNVSLGADFRITPRDLLNVDVKLLLPRLNVEQNLDNSFTSNGIVCGEHRYNDVAWNRENVEASVKYTHILKPEVSDIAVTGSFSKIRGRRPSDYFLDGSPVNRSVSGGSPLLPSLQVDYKYKMNIGTFSTGTKLTYRRNDIYHRFYERSGDDWLYSEAMSNDLLHTEIVPAAYVMFASRIGKKFSYKAGLRGESSMVTLKSRHDAVDRHRHSLFLAPSLSGVYELSGKEEFSLVFSRRIGRPSYPQLNPYMSMVDAVTYERGNMHLNPEKSTKLDFAYSLRGDALSLFVDGYLNHTTDYISQITVLDADRLITTYVNADTDLKAGLDVSLNMNPCKWMNFAVGANTYYATVDGVCEGADVSNSGWVNNSNAVLDLTPWKGGGIQLQYLLSSPQYYPQLTTAFTHQMNIGLKQRLLNENMALSLLVTDVFDTAKWEVASHNTIFELTNISRNKSRMLWLGISYNFNSFKQKAGKKGEVDRSLIKLGM